MYRIYNFSRDVQEIPSKTLSLRHFFQNWDKTGRDGTFVRWSEAIHIVHGEVCFSNRVRAGDGFGMEIFNKDDRWPQLHSFDFRKPVSSEESYGAHISSSVVVFWDRDGNDGIWFQTLEFDSRISESEVTFNTGSEGNFTSRMVNYFELIKGLHYIIGPAEELITAVGITLHQWPVWGMN